MEYFIGDSGNIPPASKNLNIQNHYATSSGNFQILKSLKRFNKDIV
jgi:hypothetical protein